MSNTFQDCAFKDSSVDLHVGVYINCVFERCELVFDGRPVHLEGNAFLGCHWSFKGPAEATLQLLEVLCRQDPQVARDVGLRLGLVSEQTH